MALVNAKQASNAMNVTVRRVEQLVHDGLPREERGKYDLGKCLLWYIRYLQKALEHRAVPSADGEMAGLGDARVRSIKADAEMKELELARTRGELIPLSEVEKVFGDLIVTTKTQMLSIGARVAAELVGETNRTIIQTKIESAVKEALTHCARGDWWKQTSRQ